jgi:DNA primase
MALYTQSSRERVRDTVDFVELVSARTELRRAGPRNYEGLCPFHEERTPSFGIDPVQKVYYCFGCQASGDLFTFVQETEGLDFRGALEMLADRYGIELELEREDPAEAQRRQRRERLLELVARTTAYYERYLWEAEEARGAREYLAERGLQEQALRAFRVGYAPSAWDRVLLASRRGGFSERELYDTGLAQRSQQNGQPYDRFRSRIMFPLADVRGRVLGFGARAMRAEQKPKYLNTSDNDVYHKGRHLYGADVARAQATKAGEVILCEGYTDVIAMHQAGLANVVGLMGTALTDEQVGELARLAQTVLLALDADSAGQEAMLKAYRLAARRKLELRVVELPAGADPAELVKEGGPGAIKEAISRSVPFVRFRVDRILAGGDDSSPEGRDRMLAALRPVLATLPPSSMRMELTRLISGRLGLPESLAERLLAEDQGGPGTDAPTVTRGSSGGGPTGGWSSGKEPRGEGSSGKGPRGGGPSDGGSPQDGDRRARAARRVLTAREQMERSFLAQCIAAPEPGRVALEEMDVEGMFTSGLLRRAATHLRERGLSEPLKEMSEPDEELVALLAELVVEAGRWQMAGGQGRPATLEVQRLQLELAGIDRRIIAARAQGAGEVTELARLREEVKRRFDNAQERALQETGASD